MKQAGHVCVCDHCVCVSTRVHAFVCMVLLMCKLVATNNFCALANAIKNLQFLLCDNPLLAVLFFFCFFGTF